MWTLDMEKQYWFATEMNHDESIDFSRSYFEYNQVGRTLLIDQNGKPWVIECYQSKVKELTHSELLPTAGAYLMYEDELLHYEKGNLKIWNLELKSQKKK